MDNMPKNMFLEFKLIILYYLYFSFFLTVFLINRKSLGVQYFFNLTDIVLLISGCLFLKKDSENKWNLVILIAIILFSFLSILKGTHINTSILILKIYFTFVFFKLNKFSIEQIVSFLNRTYLLYSILSLFIFIFLPNKLYPLLDHPLNYIDFKFIRYLALQSIEGGTSTIDSYSALIFLINIFIVNKRTKFTNFMIFFSFILILYSLKMTPLIGLIAGIISYFIIRNKFSSLIYMTLTMTVFIIIINLLFIDPEIYGSIRFSSIMYIATHARSMIWVQQLEIFYNQYNYLDYIFGNFTSELFSVQAFQLDGSEVTTNYDNPHNTYLLLFFKSPLLISIFYLIMIKMIYFNFNRKTFVIISFILIAGFSNSSLISLGNPVYLIILAYLLTHQEFKTNTSLV